jgi:hypothetical protein
MSSIDPAVFLGATLTTGAILAGFCGTFLSFRIQREAAYYRQPGDKGEAKDETHFTVSLALLLLTTICTAVFGIVFPLLALSGSGLSMRPGLCSRT